MPLIIDSQIFPSLNYFKLLVKEKDVKIELCDKFEKRSFRNRYLIATANGMLSLTAPVAGGREQRCPMKEVKIDDTENWRKKHWKAITSAYKKAPFFEFYSEKIQGLLFQQESDLITMNMNILHVLIGILKLDVLVSLTDSFVPNYETGTDYRNRIKPGDRETGLSGFQPKYPQVFEDRTGFLPDMSILDLLFCEGPNASNLLKEAVKI